MTKILKTGIDPHLPNHKGSIRVTNGSNKSMFMAKRVDENAVAASDSTVVTCFDQQFLSDVIDGIERVPSSRLSQSDDVVPYPSCLLKSSIED
ncbi:unnamed protein product [Angiostrongylus costaricensis]|uniref:Transposase n=1 Tax=Angiostrongylus costaricensis TaxID=334426 RepID=A0A0R3PYX6_ANGCS|nr:unnamed protein product [Angiostrongylus costaricensis]